MVTPNDASMPTAPYAVADNPHSWFEHFDLVFIDPPHTGWSTTASLDARKKMISVDGDVAALIEYASSFYTLYPGDIFLSGTPAGVGPMKPGDELVATIERVGTMRVKVRAITNAR